MLPRFATAVSLAATLLTALPAAAKAGTIQNFEIAATMTGCFGASCSTFVDQPTFSPFSFDGTLFDTTTDLTGSASDLVLGAFSRGSGNFSSTEPFTLQVLFTVPVGVSGSPATFAATFIGQSAGMGGSGSKPTFIDFDNTPTTFAFNDGTNVGSFQFTIFDIGNTSDQSGLDKNGTVNLLGGITNATMTGPGGTDGPIGTNGPAAVVPEPTTILLLGSGLAFAASRARRRS
jgi:hypothetical protein